jgi:hypothetical protein
MGATIFLRPQAGAFALDQITSYLDGVQGLLEDQENLCFVSFSDGLWRRPLRRALNLRNPEAVEHRSPYLRYDPAQIEFGIHWGDNRRGDGRRFLEWLLSSFACNGQDDDGYRYHGSAQCSGWLRNWLPHQSASQAHPAVMQFEDIHRLPGQEERLAEVMAGCHDYDERLTAFELYLSHVLRTPFEALWDEGDVAMSVTVLGVADSDAEEGVRLRVRNTTGEEHTLCAEWLRARQAGSPAAIGLDDYRAFVQRGSLPFGASVP